MLLYSAVSGPLRACYTSPSGKLFSPAPTLFLREAFSHAAITREDYSFTFPALSIARYLFIQLSELGHRGVNENAKTLKL